MTKILSAYENNPNIFDKINFVEYMDKWLKTIKNQVDIVTYEGYRSYLEKHIKPYFKSPKLNLQDIKMSDIEKYYQYKSVSGRLDGKLGGLSYRSIKYIVLFLILYSMKL